jgi:hypothetical protein
LDRYRPNFYSIIGDYLLYTVIKQKNRAILMGPILDRYRRTSTSHH